MSSVESPVNFPVLIDVYFLISFVIPVVSDVNSSSYSQILGGRETDVFSVVETVKFCINFSGRIFKDFFKDSLYFFFFLFKKWGVVLVKVKFRFEYHKLRSFGHSANNPSGSSLNPYL